MHDVLRIITEKPKTLDYQPGQAVDISIHKKGWEEELRPFTFTSLPEDSDACDFRPVHLMNGKNQDEASGFF